ncbi:AMP-binding protein [Streptomyces griseocarneus]|uniref:AMP-binding protein n=1 Tax=Streptomyces griseocarneus TaxID=51201 RepID=UPI00167E63E1|nr:AMP-binding protein [Streptomyces griseocarneus]MBZ6477953.1 AMP-binding protein [Streptomyces griseocarneus]GHG54459.1 fatty acid CoA ligase [Streptomyces griseocarneus]
MSEDHSAAFVSYPTAILDVLSRTPDRPVLTAADGRRVTAGELSDSTYRTARELAERGVGRGATVALLTGNTPESLVARYAAHLAGARVVHLYEGMAPAVLARIVRSVDTTMLLVDSTRHAAAKELLSLVEPPAVLGLGPGPFGEDILAASSRHEGHVGRVGHEGHEPPAFAAAVGPGDDLSIAFTGGTTGIPKGIRTTHGPYRQGLDHPLPDAGEPPRYLACTPLARLSGPLTDKTLCQGGSAVLRLAFDPGDVLATIERERITHMWLLPPLLHRLLDHPALADTDLSSLTRITYGGSPASATRLRQAVDVFGPVLYGWYGQTEVPAIAEARPHEHTVTGREGRITTGRPLPWVEVAIRDSGGRTLPSGEEGEIQVRSPGVMPGYWKRPDLTAEVLRDGWLRTGDIGYLDDDGYLFVVGRLKDVIIVVGGHVHPTEIEELLLSHPAVARCAVFGTQDADAGEHVHAAVVPRDGHTPDLEGIRAFVTAHKGPMYAPEALHLLPDIPLTSAGKPDKELLRRTLGG